MRDYFMDMVKLAAIDPNAALKLGVELRGDVNVLTRDLEEQIDGINNLGSYLEGRYREDDDAEPKPQLTPIPRIDRSRRILAVALDVVHGGQRIVTPQAVIDKLIQVGRDLDVYQPNAVIGTVLSSSKDFHWTDVNTFAYIGEEVEGISRNPETFSRD
jgi:hypothetical protein